MIIIVAITAITTFVTPNYEVTTAFRLVRFNAYYIFSNLRSLWDSYRTYYTSNSFNKNEKFGIPYLAPAVDTDIMDLKDMYIRAPISALKRRPKYMKTKDKIRQK